MIPQKTDVDVSFVNDDSFADSSLSNRELPDRSDMDSDVNDDTISCPYCRRKIHESSEFCPHCGKYISDEDAPIRFPMWVIVGLALALLVVIFGWVL